VESVVNNPSTTSLGVDSRIGGCILLTHEKAKSKNKNASKNFIPGL